MALLIVFDLLSVAISICSVANATGYTDVVFKLDRSCSAQNFEEMQYYCRPRSSGQTKKTEMQ